MRDIDELKDKAAEVFSAAVESAEAMADKAAEVSKPIADKAIEMGTPMAVKTLEAAKHALEDLEEHSEAALSAIEKHSKHKPSRRGRKVACWSLAAVGAGGVAYLLWRRSRPVEDPWAEEYWVDLKDEDGPEGIEVEESDVELDEAIVEAIEEALNDADSAEESDKDKE